VCKTSSGTLVEFFFPERTINQFESKANYKSLMSLGKTEDSWQRIRGYDRHKEFNLV
jgi:hypothetical protein